MRVCIVSMQRVPNHGSFLQAYGLKRILEEQGHLVSFGDIEPAKNPVAQSDKGGVLKKLSRVDRYVFRRIGFRKKNAKMKQMFVFVQKEHLRLQDSFMSADGYDAVVIGSDEIFDCRSQGPWGITPQRFGLVNASKAISYAASCGSSQLTDADPEDRQLMEKALKNLFAVSVRDENTARFVFDIIGADPQRHLDPVLVYDFEKEKEAAKKEICLPRRPYMAVYAYRGRISDKKEIKTIKSYAKKHGLQTVSVGGFQAWCDVYLPLNPFEVLACFEGAECVVTDTFHGAVMGAKYNKRLAVFVRESNKNKLCDLLERLGLSSLAVSAPQETESVLEKSFDYTEFNKVIRAQSGRTREYFEKYLGEN